MDALSRMLILAELHVESCGQLMLGAPWALRSEATDAAGFLYVVEGHCHLHIDGEAQARHLDKDAFVCFTQIPAHTISDRSGSPTDSFAAPSLPQITTLGGTVHYGGEGPVSHVCVGRVKFGGRCNPILNTKPHSFFCCPKNPDAHQSLRTLLERITNEASINTPGGVALLDWLVGILFASAIRSNADLRLGSGPATLRWRQADFEISRALEAIQESPEKDWTIERLADLAMMSRSAFAGKFRVLIGDTPLKYLTKRRVMCAEELLLAGVPVTQVARRVGYQSETAFSKAFQRVKGVKPSDYRQRAKIA